MPINQQAVQTFFKEKSLPAIMLIAVNYFFLAEAAAYCANQFVNLAAIWPAAGLALTAILLYGNRMLAGVGLGAFCFYLDYFSDFAETWQIAGTVAVFLALCIMLELLLAAHFIKRSLPAVIPETLGQTAIYTLIVTLTCITPTVLARFCLQGFDFGLQTNLILQGISSWPADTAGILIINPLILAWSRRLYRRRLVFLVVAPCLGLTLLSFNILRRLENHFSYIDSMSSIKSNKLSGNFQADVYSWLSWIIVFCGIGITFAIGLYLENHRLEQNRLREIERRLKRQNQALAHITRSEALASGNLASALQVLTETSASTLQVERVSIWLFNAGQTEIRCANLYELSQNRHSAGESLKLSDYPSYFQALLKTRQIAIGSVADDPITQELNRNYLKSLNICALLDAPIHFGDEFVGIVCHEQVGTPRLWTPDEQIFAGSMADLAALAFEVNKRQAAESALRISNTDLENKIQARTAELSALNTHLATEITERRETEKILRESELRLRLATKAADIGVWDWNYENNTVVYSPEWKRQLGYAEDEIANHYDEWEKRLHPDDRDSAIAANLVYIEGKKPDYENEFRLKHKDGTYRWIHSRGEIVGRDANGNTTRILGCHTDITKLKKTEEDLRVFRRFAESAGQGMVIAQLNGEIIYHNPAMIKMLENLGLTHNTPALLTMYYPPTAKEKLNQEALPAVLDSGQWLGELELGRTGNQAIPTLENLFSVSDESGRPQFIANIVTDITQQKEIELQLLKAKEAAETADRAKSMFIASMSHELRTPLNAIIGFTGILLQGLSGELNVRQHDQLKRVSRSAKHLLGLITDIIDISKIEADRIDVFAEDIDMQELVKQALEVVKAQAKEKGLTLQASIPPGLHIHTDRKRLTQCIINLLTNAVKYTEQGNIDVTIDPGENDVTVAVKDTGIGIAPDQLKRLFLPFERLDSKLRVNTPGTGLGLYLTQKIANDLLAGKVSVESQPGVGSCFKLQIAKQIETSK